MYICTAAGNNIYNTKVLYIYIYIYVRTYVIIIIISNERRYILNLLYLFPSDDFLDKIKSFAGSFQRTLRQK